MNENLLNVKIIVVNSTT